MTQHVICFSGGIGSWACARRVVDRHGAANLTLLFADTLVEDADLYRFLDDAAADIGVPVTRIAEGRTPWQVMNDVKLLGNTKHDPCSRVLKRDFIARYLRENFDPADTIVYAGIDFTEAHRSIRLIARQAAAGWRYETPLVDAPDLTKASLLAEARARGLRPSKSYDLGFSHDNCKGFCIKAGQATMALLYKHRPAYYIENEREELALRAKLGFEGTILRDRSGGNRKPLTMRDFRLRLEATGQYDKFDTGGCGCALDDEPTFEELLKDLTAAVMDAIGARA